MLNNLMNNTNITNVLNMVNWCGMILPSEERDTLKQRCWNVMLSIKIKKNITSKVNKW